MKKLKIRFSIIVLFFLGLTLEGACAGRSPLQVHPTYQDIAPKKVALLPLINLTNESLRTDDSSLEEWVGGSETREARQKAGEEKTTLYFWEQLRRYLEKKGYQVMTGPEASFILQEAKILPPWPYDQVARKIAAEAFLYTEILKWDTTQLGDLATLTARVRFRLVSAQGGLLLWEDENRIVTLTENPTIVGNVVEKMIGKIIVNALLTLPETSH